MLAGVLLGALLGGCGGPPGAQSGPSAQPGPSGLGGPTAGPPGSALRALATLAVQGRAARTGYRREQFGPAWADVDHNGCDTATTSWPAT